MDWQRPTSWSAETTDGCWYAETSASGWTIHKLRGRGPKPSARFATLDECKEFAEGMESLGNNRQEV